MYAIIETGGKQLKVEEGARIFVEKIEAEVGAEISIDKVLFVGGEKPKIGTPYVKGASVTCKVEKQGKADKIRVFKYKAKANERKTIGHRQPYTRLIVKTINA